MPTPKTQYTQSQIKEAYSLVTQDLFNRLVKAENEETVFIGSRGSFGSLKKVERQITSKLHHKRGETYAFYRFKFKPASELKQALNNALEKKYNR